MARGTGASASTLCATPPRGACAPESPTPARRGGRIPRQLTEAEGAQIAAEYAAGATVAQIAREHRIADARVIATVRTRGGTIRSPGGGAKPLSPQIAAEVVRLYRDERLTIIEIKRRLHVGSGRVKRALFDADVALRTYQLNRPTQLDAAQRSALAADYLTGATLEQLKERYGCGQATVRVVLSQQGVAVRPNSSYADRDRRGSFASARPISP